MNNKVAIAESTISMIVFEYLVHIVILSTKSNLSKYQPNKLVID
jgi:hypothetical protein